RPGREAELESRCRRSRAIRPAGVSGAAGLQAGTGVLYRQADAGGGFARLAGEHIENRSSSLSNLGRALPAMRELTEPVLHSSGPIFRPVPPPGCASPAPPRFRASSAAPNTHR